MEKKDLPHETKPENIYTFRRNMYKYFRCIFHGAGPCAYILCLCVFMLWS